MELTFASADLKRTCEDSRFAQRRLGTDCAKKLQARLADLIAAARLGEVTAGKPHPLNGDREGQFSLSLSGGRRLVLAPTDDPLPKRCDGTIDWANVQSVRIVFIGDYHD